MSKKEEMRLQAFMAVHGGIAAIRERLAALENEAAHSFSPACDVPSLWELRCFFARIAEQATSAQELLEKMHRER